MFSRLIVVCILACLMGPASAGPLTWFRTAGSAKTAQASLKDAIEVMSKGKGDLAIKHFRRISLKWPESPEAVMALQRMAKLQEKRDVGDAFKTYQILVDRHAGKFNFEEVLLAQLKIAGLVQNKKTGASRFLPGLHNEKKAIPLYELVIQNAPSWQRSAEAQFLVGVIHQSEAEYESAIGAYRKVIENFPESEFEERAAFFQVQCFHKLAVKRNTQRELDSAWVYVNRFIEKHPESDFTEQAIQVKQNLFNVLAKKSWEIAQYYDKTVTKPAAALVAYRHFVEKYPGANQVNQAKKRIRELSEDE